MAESGELGAERTDSGDVGSNVKAPVQSGHCLTISSGCHSGSITSPENVRRPAPSPGRELKDDQAELCRFGLVWVHCKRAYGRTAHFIVGDAKREAGFPATDGDGGARGGVHR
ncbi:hypothetical protein RUND412_008263 [Rhizina undulata]